ncbi:hypothetical protein D3C71_1895960 [compost metagenome]
MQQLLRLGADLLPVVLERLQLGERLDRQVRSGRVLGKQVEETVDRRQETGMVAQLTGQLVAYPTAQVNIGDREGEDKYECNFHGRLLVEKMAMRHGISPPA